MMEGRTLAEILRSACRSLIFVSPLLLGQCGASVGGGIVDNGQHPSDDGRGKTEGKTPTNKTGSDAPDGSPPVSAGDTATVSVSLAGVKFDLPPKFVTTEIDQTHGFYRRHDDWIRMTVVASVCDGSAVRANSSGTKIITCGEDWTDFETAGGKYLRMNYKLGDGDRDFVASTVKD